MNHPRISAAKNILAKQEEKSVDERKKGTKGTAVRNVSLDRRDSEEPI